MITMAHDEHAQFVEQISEFAAENAFEIRIAPPKLDPTDVLIQMRREDVKLLASPIIDPGITDLRYDVAIYENEGRAASMAALDQLINDLRAFVERIEGITTTVLK